MKIEENKPLAPLTTFNVGGTAEYFSLVKTPEELIEAIGWAKEKDLPVKVFGGGSNSFFTDGLHHALVIRILGGQVEKIDELTLKAPTGTPLALIINKANENGMAGIEKMAGIPGTIGGAVAGNAGAYGTSISEWVSRVEIWDGEKRRWLTKDECQFDYRESIFKKQPWYVLQVELKFKPGKPEELKAASDECNQTRHGRYPAGTRGPGCYFKNIILADLTDEQRAKIPAEVTKGGKVSTGWLVDQAGLKGASVGPIQVADFHGNFIINTGEGTAQQVVELQEKVQAKIKEKFGFAPEPEARLL